MKRTLIAFALLPLLLSCSKDTISVGGESDILQTDTIMKAVPNGNFDHPSFGEEQWFAYGSIIGKDGTPANGVVQAHYFADGMFTLEMQLNVEKPREGVFLQAWLRDEDGNWEPTGRPRSHFGDVRHQLQFESERDLRSYTNAVITRELDDGNPEPGLVVAEGTLRVVER